MTGWSLGLRTGNDGSLQQLAQNGAFYSQNSYVVRKGSKTSLSGSREKEKFLPSICRVLVRKKVGMLILVAFALLAFGAGFSMVNKGPFSDVLLVSFFCGMLSGIGIYLCFKL